MLTSLAVILLAGMFSGWVFKRMRLPSLLGMLIAGIVVGPHVLDLLDGSLLSVSSDVRQLALIIILTRAGLSLNACDLKKVGRPALLLCFVPACFEMIGMIVLAPWLLNISVLDAAIMGAVVAAVSPAVIVPKMLRLMKNGYGTNKSIPQMIMAGASVDDVFVIVVFAGAVGLAQGKGISAASLLQIPVSIAMGIVFGILLGMLLTVFFKKSSTRDTSKVIILLGLSFLLVAVENLKIIPFSGLLATMSIGATIQKTNVPTATQLAKKYEKLWVAAEAILFVLVGATVDLHYAFAAGLAAILVIGGALAFRIFGVWICTIKTNLSHKEKVFCMTAYIPKATVQAAIGAVPLALGLPCGNMVLTVAVLSILITAPLGAIGVDATYKRLLHHQLPIANPEEHHPAQTDGTGYP